ncbi:class I SAM-dependent methyltransferase [Chelatococcus reniformis]|nr:class I SAM-dependent methyltransferase [Chelatococcus reniformis]
MRWIDYWNSDSPIYVSERHKTLHYQGIARDTAALLAELGAGATARVLDYGCGEALSAERVARSIGELVLCDGAPAVRDRLAARFSGAARIAVRSPAEVAAEPPGRYDVILVNSMIQYLTRVELDGLLAQWLRGLAPGGTLALADVIPPDVSAATDALALMRFGGQGGFLAAAVAGLVRTTFSDYRKLRGTLGLSRYSEAEMTAALEAGGFEARRRRPNLGHNQARMTFLARPTDAPHG